MEVVSRALVFGAFGWSGNAINAVVMRVGSLQGTYFWSVWDGFEWEVVSRTSLGGALGWSGNVIKTGVMRAGPLQGTCVWRVGDGFDLEVVSRALVLSFFASGARTVVIQP